MERRRRCSDQIAADYQAARRTLRRPQHDAPYSPFSGAQLGTIIDKGATCKAIYSPFITKGRAREVRQAQAKDTSGALRSQPVSELARVTLPMAPDGSRRLQMGASKQRMHEPSTNTILEPIHSCTRAGPAGDSHDTNHRAVFLCRAAPALSLPSLANCLFGSAYSQAGPLTQFQPFHVSRLTPLRQQRIEGICARRVGFALNTPSFRCDLPLVVVIPRRAGV